VFLVIINLMITLSQSSIHPYTADFIRAIREAGGHELLSHEVIAVNDLVKNLTAYQIWDRLVGLYPFVGRGPVPHSFNLINPLFYRMIWFGGIVHDALGITTNGTTGSGDTTINPALGNNFVNSMTFGVYSRTDGVSGGVDLGAQAATNLHIKFTDNNGYFDNCFSSGRISLSMTSALGLILSSRQASNDHGGWQNGVRIINGGGAQGTITSTSFTIASRQVGSLFTARNYAMCIIGYGLTDIQNKLLYDSVQAFQITLGRSV
jgi:hypothetical protein